MTWKIRYQNGVFAEREESRVQAPKRVVEAATMQENDRRQFIVERFTAGTGENLLSFDFKIHDQAFENFRAARNPISKSAFMSSMSSSPTDSRTMSSVIPAATSASASMRECVVVAG